jgi:hypothetical protein
MVVLVDPRDAERVPGGFPIGEVVRGRGVEYEGSLE